MKKISVVCLTVLFATLYGCGGTPTELHMMDTSVAKDTGVAPARLSRTVIFPNGTIFGGASADQASGLAKIFVDSHNTAVKELLDIEEMSAQSLKNEDAIQKAVERSEQKMEVAAAKIFEESKKNAVMAHKNAETSRSILAMIEQLSKNQGSGEITVFFPEGSDKLRKNSADYKRLVEFADFLARESKGRKVLFVSIGSSSAQGDGRVNRKIAKSRAEFPVAVMNKYLVNVPHEFYKVYGVGDEQSQKDAKMKNNEKYRNTRLIAVFETDRVLAPREEPSK